MGGDFEVGRAADGLDRLLERAIGKGGEAAALIADQMMMVLFGVNPLVSSRIAADLDPLHEVEPVELIQRAVDTRPADRIEPSVDLQCRYRAGFCGQQLDHLAPGRATAVSGLIKALNCCLGPTHGRERIR